jgi:hypothetical protein
MQSDRLIGVGLQYLLIDIFSLRQPASLVMLPAKVYRLLDG